MFCNSSFFKYCMTILLGFLFCTGCSSNNQNTDILTNSHTDTAIESSFSAVEFDIDEGKLVGYSGNSKSVLIPDTVTSISSAAFSSTDSNIESIHIGKNVASIADDAFYGVSSLTSISVDSDNSYYTTDGTYLAAKDGSTIFVFAERFLDTEIFDYADATNVQGFCEDGFKVILHEAVLYFDEPIDLEDGATQYSTTNCMLEKIEAYGKTVNLNTSFLGNHAVSIQTEKGVLLITDYVYSTGDTYIITPTSFWEQHNMDNLTAENCNEPIVCYYYGDDGILHFRCSPRKYLFTGATGDLLTYSVGLDELYCVDGNVKIENEKPVLTATSKTILNEKYTEAQLLSEFKAMEISESMSLNEFLKQNNTQYERFEFAE